MIDGEYHPRISYILAILDASTLFVNAGPDAKVPAVRRNESSSVFLSTLSTFVYSLSIGRSRDGDLINQVCRRRLTERCQLIGFPIP